MFSPYNRMPMLTLKAYSNLFSSFLTFGILLKKRKISAVLFGVILLITMRFIFAASHNLHIDYFYIYPVGSTYVKWVTPLQLLAKDSSMVILLEMFFYCIFALFIGCYFLEKLFGVSASFFNSIFFLLSGFVPGYLILIAVNRLVTFALPNGMAMVVLPILYLCVIFYCYRHRSKGTTQNNPLMGVFTIDKKTIAVIPAAFTCIAIAIFFLISQAQTDNVHIIGDGAIFFLDLIRSQSPFARSGHFPVITQHYDEIMFLYPIFQDNISEMYNIGNAINCYWILYAFGKASCFSIIVVSVYLLSNSKLLGMLCAALLFFGGLQPNPFVHIWLFDSRNPLGVNMHIGRVILAILPIAAFAIAHTYFKFPARINTESSVVLILLGLGLSSLSLHFTMIIFLSVAMALFLIIPISIRAGAYIIGFSLFSTIALYSYPETMGIGICCLVICVLTMSLLAFRGVNDFIAHNGWTFWENWFLKIIAMQVFLVFLGVGAGLLFLGNSLVITHYPFHLPTPLFLTRLMAPVPMQFGRNPFCGVSYIGHCVNIISFTAFYGLPFILLGICALTALYKSLVRPVPAISDNAVSPLFGILPFVSILLVSSFFMYDFMDANSVNNFMGVWVKTRLPEPWFYSCIVLSFIFLWKTAIPIGKVALTALLMLYIGGQSIVSEKAGVLGQLMANLDYIKEHLLLL